MHWYIPRQRMKVNLLLCRVARILLYEDCKKLAKTIDDMNKPSCMMYPLRCFAVMFPGVEEKHTCTARPSFFFCYWAVLKWSARTVLIQFTLERGHGYIGRLLVKIRLKCIRNQKLYAIWNVRLTERFFLIDIMYYHEKYSFLRNSWFLPHSSVIRPRNSWRCLQKTNLWN